MADKGRSGLTYAQAGVDIDAGNRMVNLIKPLVRATARPGADAEIGGFGGLFDLKRAGFTDPVLVATTDGVGTKVKIAIETGVHDTIGIDLVAMSVNDLVVQGAEPLFFLDYYATGRLDVDTAERVIRGIVEGCLQAGCALVGGETAEMPGMYTGDDYDLAGFCVGLVEKDAIIDGTRTRAGDAIIGLAASGPHSNGYSLIRRLLTQSGAGPATQLDGVPLYDLLLRPTRIYVKSVLELLRQSVPVHGIAHITGGGPTGNIPRVLPANLEAVIDARRWPRPAVFDWLERAGNVSRDEMYRTFNCGLGMTICVPAPEAERALGILRGAGEDASIIGEVRAGDREVVIVE
jgi:phosphoribosylformylglycinamidine cyclo-ligase